MKDKSLSYLNAPKGKEISWEFFIKHNNPTDVSKKVYPKIWKKHWNTHKGKKKSWSIPRVNELRKLWEEKNWLITVKKKRKIKQYGKNVLHTYDYYIFNLTPLFVYMDMHLPKKLSDIEKNFLRAIFDVNSLLGEDNLIVRKLLYYKYKKKLSFVEAIPYFYFKSFYLRYIEEKAGLKKETKYHGDTLGFIKSNIDFLINTIPKNIIKMESDDERELKPIKLEPINERTGADVILEKHIEEIQNYEKSLEFNEDFYYAHYLALHKYYPKIVENLDKKMKFLIFL
jgi:hypothetical protein